LKRRRAALLCEVYSRSQENEERTNGSISAGLRLLAFCPHGIVRAAVRDIEASRPIRRIPIRRRDEIIFIPTESIASVVAHGELLCITTAKKENHTINYRLKDLEARLDPALFFRLSRGTIVNLTMIDKVTVLPGGLYRVFLSNGLELDTSRLQSKIMRRKLLRL
jgi:DNA-binding LytR/AlgR family response regulator